MTSTMAARRSRSSAPAPRPANDQTTFLSRWLKVWVILLTVVTLVVVVYLVFITNSLANINGNLATADRAVGATGAAGNVSSLPNQVDRINGALTGIDDALKPIPGQAGEIVTALTSINDKLTAVDSSLQDTSGVLSTVLGTVNGVSSTLVDANNPGDRLGVQNIHHRVAALNGRNSPRQGSAVDGGGPGPFATGGNLSAAEADARAIVGSLDAINTSLTGVCRSPVVGIVAGCAA
jgi:hypothetical protein